MSIMFDEEVCSANVCSARLYIHVVGVTKK